MALSVALTYVLGTIAFFFFWVLAVFPNFPVLPIGRTAGALLGAALMVIFQIESTVEAYGAVDLPILGLLFGTMAVSVYVERAGLFHHLGDLLSWGDPGAKALMCRICALVAIASALFTNDTICVAMTSFVLRLCYERGLPPEPFLVALATSANIGSGATPIGNPQNLIIAVQGKISFGLFLTKMLPAVIVGVALNTGMILLVYWKRLTPNTALSSAPPSPLPRTTSKSIYLTASPWKPFEPRFAELSAEQGLPTFHRDRSVGRNATLRHSRSHGDAYARSETQINILRSFSTKTPTDIEQYYRLDSNHKKNPNLLLPKLSIELEEGGQPKPEKIVVDITKQLSQKSDDSAHFAHKGDNSSVLDVLPPPPEKQAFPGRCDSLPCDMIPEEADTSVISKARVRLFKKICVFMVTLGMLAALLSGLDMSWSAITASVVLMVLDFKDSESSLDKVSYSLLVFFSGMFITVDGFNRTGIPALLWNKFEPLARINSISGVLMLSIVIIILSNVASNVPTVLLLGPQVVASTMALHGATPSSSTKAWLILAWVSTLAGNLTLVGSAANLIVSEQARRDDASPANLSCTKHLRFGPLSTCVITFIGLPLIHLTTLHD